MKLIDREFRGNFIYDELGPPYMLYTSTLITFVKASLQSLGGFPFD